MNREIADLRINYTQAGLTEGEAAANPFDQFRRWWEDAVSAQLREPNAMTLATLTPDGHPDARIVLLKGFDEQGFIFYTNYDSAKGQQLQQNPVAALVFWWAELERQIRIRGTIERVSAQVSDDYFHSRPLGSQLGAWASPQSQVIENREVLEERLNRFQNQYEQGNIPRPPHWGGFRVIPKSMEFWQGRPNRLHDRLHYLLLDNGQWKRERLAP